LSALPTGASSAQREGMLDVEAAKKEGQLGAPEAVLNPPG